MKRELLYRLIEDHPVILDGATGSNLQKAGMPAGVCPELWIIEHEEALIALQEAYINAGTEILFSPTFSANRVKLAEYDSPYSVEEVNEKLVEICKKAAKGRAYIAGDMTMTGQSMVPVGMMTFDELTDIYKQQAKALDEAGVDLFVVETMMSLAETRAAVLAIKEVSDKPVMASLTFQEDGRTLHGTDPATAVVVLQSIGTDVIGVNCSTGPEEMLKVVKQMKEYASVPILAKPNAGLPILVNEETIYPMESEEFASFGPALVEAGAGLIGGCCGTTPAHIQALAESVSGLKTHKPYNQHPAVIASERQLQEISLGGEFLIIGERINPTGKKKFQEELRAGNLTTIDDMAEQQEEKGAKILDVNLGTNGIDEKETMLEAIRRISMVTNLPLSVDTSRADVMEAALRQYPGRALMNSISLEKEKVDKFLPLAKKYGAMFILLPLSDTGLPKSLEEKKNIIRELIEKAENLGIPRSSIVIDGLVTTVGANKKAALETLETIRYCTEDLKIPTVVGLSNISFGLPERNFVNTAFAAMAIQSGLTMAICNPSNEMLMNVAAASDLLMNRPEADLRYIDRVSKAENKISQGQTAPAKEEQSLLERIKTAVIKGSKDRILTLVKQGIDEGHSPKEMLDTALIPGINEVGSLYEKQIYFLPQLIASANTMEEAVKWLEPMLMSDSGQDDMPVIVIATVEGDIHDIGKNLVALMLRNYGFKVIDLGKDVAAEKIIEAAEREHASIIALSALMTTTMMRMKDTVLLRKEKNLDAKVIIGGAVTTPSFAEEIGADGYSTDAADAVRLVKELLNL